MAVIADAAVVLGAQHLLIRPGREVGFADLVNFSTRPADYREGLKVLPDLQSCHVLSMAEYIWGSSCFRRARIQVSPLQPRLRKHIFGQ